VRLRGLAELRVEKLEVVHRKPRALGVVHTDETARAVIEREAFLAVHRAKGGEVGACAPVMVAGDAEHRDWIHDLEQRQVALDELARGSEAHQVAGIEQEPGLFGLHFLMYQARNFHGVAIVAQDREGERLAWFFRRFQNFYPARQVIPCAVLRQLPDPEMGQAVTNALERSQEGH